MKVTGWTNKKTNVEEGEEKTKRINERWMEKEKRIESINPTTSSTTHSKQRHIQTPTKHTHSPRTQQLNNKHKRETREEKESEWTTSGTKKHVRCIATHCFWATLRLNMHNPLSQGHTQNKQQERRWEVKPPTHGLNDEHTRKNKHTHPSNTQSEDWSTVYDMCILHKGKKKQNWSAL